MKRKHKVYKRYRKGKRGGQHYYISPKKNYSMATYISKRRPLEFFGLEDKSIIGDVEHGRITPNRPYITKVKTSKPLPDKFIKEWDLEIIDDDKPQNYGLIIAQPWGEGQQRFKKITKKGIELEQAQIPIGTKITSKSHKAPVTEEEVKDIIESFKPQELGKGPRDILITERGGMMGSYSDTYGEAFKHGGIKLYSKPYKQPKKGEPYFLVGKERVSEAEMGEKYKFDVIPHEIAHHRLGHTAKKPNDEIAADRWAAEWRERRGIEDKPYYRKGGPRRSLFL